MDSWIAIHATRTQAPDVEKSDKISLKDLESRFGDELRQKIEDAKPDVVGWRRLIPFLEQTH